MNLRIALLITFLLFHYYQAATFSSYEVISNDSLYSQAISYLSKKEYDSSKLLLKQLAEFYAATNNISSQAVILNSIGVVCYKAGQLDSSLTYYSEALSKYRILADSNSISSVKLNMGMVYKDQGLYERATAQIFNSISYFEKVQDSSSLSTSYNTIANIYSRMKNYDASVQYHTKALEIRKHIGKPSLIASSYNNLGLAYRQLNEPDSALKYYKMSLDIKLSNNLMSRVKSTLNNIAQTLLDIDSHQEALQYLERALKYNSNQTDGSRAITYNLMGEIYFRLNDLNSSKLYLDSAAQIINQFSLMDQKKDNLEYKVRVYTRLDPEKALIYANELLQINDSLYTLDRSRALAEMRTKYETRSKEQEIVLLKERQARQEVDLQFRQKWMAILALFSILITIIGVLIWSRWKVELKARKEIETLLQELHHRVKNNLQLLSGIFSLQSSKLTDVNALEAVRSSENRVNAMGLIHRQLYNKDTGRFIDLGKYIEQLVEGLIDSYDYNHEVDNIIINTKSLELNVDKVISIGLIVNELVSNTFKYAFPNTKKPYLKITLHEQKSKIFLSIVDNGPGINETTMSKDSMGLNIVKTLSTQLKADTHWEVKNGVAFNLSMKLK